ncbi:hypothetical protein HAX54_031120 [Datura stramonium]|uniref:Uncharacterized protein n=1 Tax=Datura stramonium TaxID=4076 RepID=A0ABS8SBU2_DATST|nr:hypothetical protein [Datura stramonium]
MGRRARAPSLKEIMEKEAQESRMAQQRESVYRKKEKQINPVGKDGDLVQDKTGVESGRHDVAELEAAKRGEISIATRMLQKSTGMGNHTEKQVIVKRQEGQAVW